MAPTNKFKKWVFSGRRNPAGSPAPNQENVSFRLDDAEGRPRTSSQIPLSDRSYSECTEMDLDTSSQGTPTPQFIDRTADEPTAAWDADFIPLEEPVVQHVEPSLPESEARTDTCMEGAPDIHSRVSQLEKGFENHVKDVKGCFDQLATMMGQHESQRKNEERNRERQRHRELRQRKEEERKRQQERQQERKDDIKQRKEEERKRQEERQRERKDDMKQRKEEERRRQQERQQDRKDDMKQRREDRRELFGFLGQGVQQVCQTIERGFNSPSPYQAHAQPTNMSPPASEPGIWPVPLSANMSYFPGTFNNNHRFNNNARYSHGYRKKRGNTRVWETDALTVSPAVGVTGPVPIISSTTRVYSTSATQTQNAQSPEATSSAPESSTYNRPESPSSAAN